MATFRLHRFSHVHTLKSIQPSYLLALLDPYQSYFAGHGVELGAVNGHDLDYEALRNELMSLDPSAPPKLMDDLYYVHEMSDDAGMDELLAAIEELPASERIELHLSSDPTPADVAVQVRLQAPELLERCHAERSLTKKRSFEYYQPKEGADLTFRMPTKKQLAALEAAFDERLDQLKRGRNSKVFIYEKDDGVWFLVRHGQPCKRESTVTQDGSGTVYFRPEIYDVLRYDPQSGDLSMNAETKKIGALYREQLGLHIFGDAAFFPGTSKYTLEPLLRDGEDCLVCSDIEGMEWVKLKEAHYAWGGPESEIEIRKANDLFAAYRRRDRSLPNGRLLRANFAVKFADSKTPRTVSIRPSNVASFARDGDAVLVEQWLVKRGFVGSAAQPKATKSRTHHAQLARAVAHT